MFGNIALELFCTTFLFFSTSGFYMPSSGSGGNTNATAVRPPTSPIYQSLRLEITQRGKMATAVVSTAIMPELDVVESPEFNLEAVLSSSLTYLQHDKRSDRKTKRNEGKCYVSSRGQLVAAKEFSAVESCCKRRCFSKMVADEQRSAFKRFWENGSYNCQNNFLAGMMSSVETQYKKRCPKTRNRRCAWHYSVDNRGKKVTVCQLFFRSLLQVSEKRLRNLQEKLLSSEAIVDRRGTGGGGGKRRGGDGASGDAWALLPHFRDTLPPHGPRGETTRTALFESFADYYEAVTGNELRLSPSTFAKQFNSFVDYSFLCARK